MQTANSTIQTISSKRWPLIAPGSFRRVTQYRFKGFRPRPKRQPSILLVTEQGAAFSRYKGQAANILFRYLYRDAANYKQYSDVVFSNPTFLSPGEIEGQIRACLKDGEFFIAQQVNLEECFFDVLHDDDHPWHTFDHVEATTLYPFDPDNWNQKQHRRDITEFLADLERACRAGWNEMNVRADMLGLLERHKAKIQEK